MKKRGSLQYKYIVDLIVSLLIIVTIWQAADSYGSQDIFYKVAVSKDISLVISQIDLMEGDVEVIYDKDLKDYTLHINENTVKIYKTKIGSEDITAAENRFYGPKFDNVIVKSPENLKIIKKDGIISFENV